MKASSRGLRHSQDSLTLHCTGHNYTEILPLSRADLEGLINHLQGDHRQKITNYLAAAPAAPAAPTGPP